MPVCASRLGILLLGGGESPLSPQTVVGQQGDVDGRDEYRAGNEDRGGQALKLPNLPQLRHMHAVLVLSHRLTLCHRPSMSLGPRHTLAASLPFVSAGAPPISGPGLWIPCAGCRRPASSASTPASALHGQRARRRTTSTPHAAAARRGTGAGTGAGAGPPPPAPAPAPAPRDDLEDHFFLPKLDMSALGSTTVLGAVDTATGEPSRNHPRNVADQQKRGQPRKTVAQQRAMQRDAETAGFMDTKNQDDETNDHEFIRAAREAIAMAATSDDVVGIADVSTRSTPSGSANGIPPNANGAAISSARPSSADPTTSALQRRGELAKDSTLTPNALVSETRQSLLIPISQAQRAAATANGVNSDRPIFTARRMTSADLEFDGPVPDDELVDNTMRSTESMTGQASRLESGRNLAPLLDGRKPDFIIRAGDLVMHDRHGVGRFRGLEHTSERRGPKQEYAVVEYRDGDVYIPLSQLDLLRRLTREQEETVSVLDVVTGSVSYQDHTESNNMRSRRAKYNARVKARGKIREQLVNLHGLYAARDSISRPKYKAFLKIEQAFSQNCPFELTADQQAAVDEIMTDISEKSRPMDRLLCGDVGFGKTEVALRCAFRVLLGDRQVAILAPTTILAQQHYEVFRSRFEELSAHFPVACLTRFGSRKALLEARQQIASGEVRIIVGTHMLLGDTTKFHNLGLLIVDEEHRFGVNQKEKLRCKHKDVDTLFLSATPIPRTLHLALSGLRDTSILKTAPEGRKPVVTKVAAAGAGLVRRALTLELDRAGQIFYVVPRIEGIDATASWVSGLCPNARVLVAHGSHKDLERRILAFASGQFDVLVCTSIIENGINMPRVNTMIIQDAARFGMAQLHQLRGRVGRCEVQAYAWLLYSNRPGGDSLSARERLDALARFSGLGAGFAIAQRDMEMRGVGTVLGVEQHGNSSMDAEEYSKMLIEELESARTGVPVQMSLPTSETCEIYLPVASYIPPEYIPSLDEKMVAYGILSGSQSIKELNEAGFDLERRYGPFPAPLQRHICIMRLKLLAKSLGIRKILVQRQHVVLDWAIDEPSLKRLVAFLKDKRARTRFEVVEDEERVLVRGLGICSGDLQLAKLLQWLDIFGKSAVDFHARSAPTLDVGVDLVERLSAISASEHEVVNEHTEKSP
jgi:transcription-repair coupling factor